MIHYGFGPELIEAVHAFAQAHPGNDWLCRHAVRMTPREQRLGLDGAFERLVESFVLRFGTAPKLPPSD